MNKLEYLGLFLDVLEPILLMIGFYTLCILIGIAWEPIVQGFQLLWQQSPITAVIFIITLVIGVPSAFCTLNDMRPTNALFTLGISLIVTPVFTRMKYETIIDAPLSNMLNTFLWLGMVLIVSAIIGVGIRWKREVEY